jgi:predicted transcriptional regulator
MLLNEILIPTLVARPGTKVVDVLRECVEKHVPGIPYCNAQGQITGRVSVRHVFCRACVPPDVVSGAHMLGDQVTHLDLPSIEKCRILDEPVEKYLLEKRPCLTSNSPAVKAIALMEKYQVSYIFVVDEEYQGIVTQLGIATLLLKHWETCPVEYSTDA